MNHEFIAWLVSIEFPTHSPVLIRELIAEASKTFAPMFDYPETIERIVGDMLTEIPPAAGIPNGLRELVREHIPAAKNDVVLKMRIAFGEKHEDIKNANVDPGDAWAHLVGKMTIYPARVLYRDGSCISKISRSFIEQFLARYRL